MKRLRISKVKEKRKIRIYDFKFYFLFIDMAFDEMCCSYGTLELS